MASGIRINLYPRKEEKHVLQTSLVSMVSLSPFQGPLSLVFILGQQLSHDLPADRKLNSVKLPHDLGSSNWERRVCLNLEEVLWEISEVGLKYSICYPQGTAQVEILLGVTYIYMSSWI